MTVASGCSAEVEVVVDRLMLLLSAVPQRERLRWCARVTERVAAVEAATLAEGVDASGADDRAKNLLKYDKGSTRADKFRKRQRAAAVAGNPELGGQLADGSLSLGQLDAIADAAKKSDGAAATDHELIGRIQKADADQARKLKDDWLKQRDSQADIDAKHERQRRLRSVHRTRSLGGLPALLVQGDQFSIDQTFGQLERRAEELYRADGGRDLPAEQHPRSHSQRMFDAACELFGGIGADGELSGSRKAKQATAPAGRSRAGGRPVGVFTIGIDSDHPAAQWAGRGPIPTPVLQELLGSSDFMVAVLGPEPKSEPLWLGRARRHASVGQYIGLAVRDGGCVTCNAPPERCDVHHLMPANAPGKGKTDTPDMALQCQACHRRLHDNNLTLYWDHHLAMWRTRPATANETAPSRPADTRRTPDLQKPAKAQEPGGTRQRGTRQRANRSTPSKRAKASVGRATRSNRSGRPPP